MTPGVDKVMSTDMSTACLRKILMTATVRVKIPGLIPKAQRLIKIQIEVTKVDCFSHDQA